MGIFSPLSSFSLPWGYTEICFSVYFLIFSYSIFMLLVITIEILPCIPNLIYLKLIFQFPSQQYIDLKILRLCSPADLHTVVVQHSCSAFLFHLEYIFHWILVFWLVKYVGLIVVALQVICPLFVSGVP